MKFFLHKTIEYKDGKFAGLAKIVNRKGYARYDLWQNRNYLGCMLGGAEHNYYMVSGLFLDKGFTRRVNTGVGTSLLRGLALEAKKAGHEQLVIQYTRNYILLRMAYEKLSYDCEYIERNSQGGTWKTRFAGRRWFENQNIMVETTLAKPNLLYRYENKFIPLTSEAGKWEASFQGDKIIFHKKRTRQFFDPAKISRIEIFNDSYRDVIVPLNKLNF